eukprot:TRINITY_DN31691_c0_g1_i1.p1 TRINITY_DN31691_c0_g1~~TRINITY_DN31691_c0_g1_i1.p1  ORF type:complete len:345 (+),score=64.46 TRINITY_DN31691_c0_g1_i1:147-1181(+)
MTAGSDNVPLNDGTWDVAKDKAGDVLSSVGRYLLAGSVVVLLVGGSFIGQYLQVTYRYDKPFWLTYSNTAVIGLLLPVSRLLDSQLPFRRLAWQSLPFAFLWFIANYLYALSLSRTSVASVLSIEQSATVLVFVLSVIILREPLSVLKCTAVLLCIAGVVLVSFADRVSGPAADGWLGDVLVSGSTIMTATYMVLFKKFLAPTDQSATNLSVASVTAFLGCIGVWNIVLFWPGVLVVHFIGFERFALPSSGAAWGLYVGSMLVGLLFNSVLNWGVASTSPLFMRIVVPLSIPASFLIDVIVLHTAIQWLWVLGVVSILAGFALFSFVLHRAERLAKRSRYETIQ